MYPDIDDVDFYKKILKKKEFSDNNIKNRLKEIYCLAPQQRFLGNYINPITPYQSILVFAATGSGKTLSAISIAENHKELVKSTSSKIFIMTKNETLNQNFKNQMMGLCSEYTSEEEKRILRDSPESIDADFIRQKFNKQIDPYYEFITFGVFVNKVLGIPNSVTGKKVLTGKSLTMHDSVLIIDEAHNLTGNQNYEAVMKLKKKSRNLKIVLLTATPISDNVTEIFEMSNMLNDFDNQLPIREELIKHKLVEKVIDKSASEHGTVFLITEKGKQSLMLKMKGKVSYLKTNEKNFPKEIEHGTRKNGITLYYCTMSEFQSRIYNIVTNQTNAFFQNLTWAGTFVFPDESFGKKGFDIYKTNQTVFDTNTLEKYSCKINEILNNIDKYPGTHFIYSSFVTFGGSALLRRVLNRTRHRHRFVVLSDFDNDTSRLNEIQRFNKSDNINGDIIKIIIGSPAIKEGVTLKNVRNVHILEPFWNYSSIDQVIGRAIRYNSHIDLPLADRYVNTFKYVAITDNGNSQDIYKYNLSLSKDRSIKEIEYILKVLAVDCVLNKSVNEKKDTRKDFTRDCDYKECEYKCSYEPETENLQVDRSTYSRVHQKMEIKFCTKFIKDMFKFTNVYTIEDIVNDIHTLIPEIDDTSAYYALTDLMKENLQDKFERNGKIKQYGRYYFLIPHNWNGDDYFSLMNPVNQNSTLPIKIINKPKKEKLVNVETLISELNQTPSAYYGSYKNKTNMIDNKFRIIVTKKVKSADLRTKVTGKICTSYTKKELTDIAIDLGIPNTSEKDKEQLCSDIKLYLTNKKLIII